MKRAVYIVIAVVVTVSVLVGSLAIWYMFTYGGLGSVVSDPRYIGDSVNLLGLEITVSSVKTTDYHQGPMSYTHALSGEDLIIFDVEMRNTADYPIAFTGVGNFLFYMVNSYGTRYDFRIGDSNCLDYTWSQVQYTRALQRVSGFDVLLPGAVVRGKEIIRVPENSPGLEIVLSSRQITSYHWDGQSIHGEREHLWPIKESWKL